VQCKR
jgi:hypothetical protein